MLCTVYADKLLVNQVLKNIDLLIIVLSNLLIIELSFQPLLFGFTLLILISHDTLETDVPHTRHAHSVRGGSFAYTTIQVEGFQH